jgi:uncharacterized protein
MNRTRLFSALAKIAVSRAGIAVLIVAVLLTAISAVLGLRLPILTSREGMVSDELPVQKRYLEFLADFGTQNQLVVVLEGEPENVRAAADNIAVALKADENWVNNVVHKIDLSMFRKAGLYYLSIEELGQFRGELEKALPDLTAALANGSVVDLLKVAEGKARSVSVDAIKDDSKLDPAFEAAEELLTRWAKFLDGEPGVNLDFAEEVLFKQAASRGDSAIDANGYMIGNEGRMVMLFVQQSQSIDDTSFILPFMDYCRKTVAATLEQTPGVTAGFTGWPVSIEEEIGLVKSDLQRVILISGALIFGLFILAFRSMHRTILVFVPLAFGVIWNLAVTLYTVGHLNYLTSVFVGILFGLGIDYGVVFIRRFDEERSAGATPREAVALMLASVGSPVLTGSATVIAAFFAIGATDQPAFSELGIVAGTGIVCVLISTMLVLPALLFRFPPKPRPVKTGTGLEWPMLRPIAGVALKFKIPVFALGLIVVVGLLTQVPKVKFDYSLDNLLPENSEAIQVANKLEEHTPYKIQYVTMIADTLEQSRTLQGLLAEASTVARVESAAMLVPPDQEAKGEMFPQIATLLQSVPLGMPEQVDVAAVKARVGSLVEWLETAQEDAFSAGRSNLVKRLESLLAKAEDVQDRLGGKDAPERELAFEKALFAQVGTAKSELLSMLSAPPVTLDAIDPSLREKFVGKSGRQAIFVFPNKDIWDREFLNEFLGQVDAASAEVFGPDQVEQRASGFAVVFKVTSEMIRKGFAQASLMAGFVVLAMLFFDFRRPSYVALTILPLATGVAVALGGMGLMGKELNLASQIALPILLGVGVDYGILMTRRWLEPDGVDLRKVTATIGGAVVLAAGTTMLGFGGLLFARHRGLIAFGDLMVVAIGACLVAALIGIPVAIQVLGLDKRDDRDS